jgi:hypothetical protein
MRHPSTGRSGDRRFGLVKVVADGAGGDGRVRPVALETVRAGAWPRHSAGPANGASWSRAGTESGSYLARRALPTGGWRACSSGCGSGGRPRSRTLTVRLLPSGRGRDGLVCLLAAGVVRRLSLPLLPWGVAALLVVPVVRSGASDPGGVRRDPGLRPGRWPQSGRAPAPRSAAAGIDCSHRRRPTGLDGHAQYPLDGLRDRPLQRAPNHRALDSVPVPGRDSLYFCRCTGRGETEGSNECPRSTVGDLAPGRATARR